MRIFVPILRLLFVHSGVPPIPPPRSPDNILTKSEMYAIIVLSCICIMHVLLLIVFVYNAHGHHGEMNLIKFVLNLRVLNATQMQF